jgi:hypothetical protein
LRRSSSSRPGSSAARSPVPASASASVCSSISPRSRCSGSPRCC